MKTILALAAHPDDLEIGCGGTLAQHSARGDKVHIYIATSGDIGGEGEIRRTEQVEAAKILGVTEVHWGGFGDTRLPESAIALMADLERVVQHVCPDTVYVNYQDDTHQDHRVIAQVARSVTRYIANVLYYETPSTIGFEPTVFMDICETLEIKLKALKAHDSQIDRTHVRLNIIEIAMATTTFRGVQAKMSCAESFVPIRMRL